MRNVIIKETKGTIELWAYIIILIGICTAILNAIPEEKTELRAFIIGLVSLTIFLLLITSDLAFFKNIRKAIKKLMK